MTAPQTVPEVLRAAQQYIAEHGWAQGTLNHDGAVCALGAIDAVSMTTLPGARWNIAEDAFAQMFPERVARLEAADVAPYQRPRPIVEWNDERGRTQAEVEKFFLLAADRAEFGSTE